MHNRTDRGLVRAGLAVLVTGLLGGGVLAVVGGPSDSRKLTADGIATGRAVAGAQALEPAPPRDAPAGEDGREVGDKVMMGDDGGSVTVSTVEDDVNAGRLFGAGEGFKYVAAEVKGCSGANEKNITFEPSYFLLRLDDGTIRDAGVGAKKPSLEGGTIPPGKCLSGWVTFTVPDGALPTGVIYDGSTRTTWTVPLPKNAKPTTTTTAKAGATETTGDPDDSGSGDGSASDGSSSTTTTRAKASTTSTTRSKATTTSTTRTTRTTRTKSTATTATTAKSTAKSPSTTGTTGKPAGSASTSTTATTGKSAPSTTAPAKPSSTTTTGGSEDHPDPGGRPG